MIANHNIKDGDTLMTNLIKTLQQKEGFSESEKMIADFLLGNYRGLAGISTREMAKRTYTSSAAIVRFSQKMGFEGYTEFKVQLMAEMMQYMSQPREDNTLSDRDSVQTLIEKVTSLEISALKDTHKILDPAAVVMALHEINKAEHIDFYAMDDNINIANMAASSFVMAEKLSTVINTMPHQYSQAASSPANHLGFIISRTGENRMLIDIARMLKVRGTKILLLTSEPDSTLGKLADRVLPVAGVKKLEELGPRIFLMGAKYVIDILFACLMTRVNFANAKQKESWLTNTFYY